MTVCSLFIRFGAVEIQTCRDRFVVGVLGRSGSADFEVGLELDAKVRHFVCPSRIPSTNTLSGPVTSVPLFHPHPGLTLRRPRD